MVDLFLSIVVEGLFWGTGAGLKKMAGRRLSQNGTSETWIGFLVYLFLSVLVFLVFVALSRT